MSSKLNTVFSHHQDLDTSNSAVIFQRIQGFAVQGFKVLNVSRICYTCNNLLAFFEHHSLNCCYYLWFWRLLLLYTQF